MRPDAASAGRTASDGGHDMSADVSAAPMPGGPSASRRQFVGFLLASPTLALAAKLDLDRPSHSGPVAASGRGGLIGLPDASDVIDLGDLIVAAEAAYQYNMVLEVTTDNRVRFELPRLEKGQGIATAVAMMVAEEIDARLADVDVELSDARLDRPFTITGSSSNVRAMWEPARALAAAARARLVTTAAQRFGVPANTLTTHDTAVFAPDGRSLSYGELTEAAAQVLVPAVPATRKTAAQRRVIGTPRGRADARAIVTGAAEYALDVDVPGALPTLVARPPDIKGTVVSYDDSVARSMPGVVAVTQIPSGIAVSARSYHEAFRARDALVITWAPGPLAHTSDADIRAKLKAINVPASPTGVLLKTVDGSFEYPFMAHAPLEVRSAVVSVTGDSAECWLASQTPVFALQQVAAALGVPQQNVTLHVVRAGGAFGCRLFCEPVVEAAQVSQAIGQPVKVMWDRADDMRHGRFRPMAQCTIRATCALGNVLSYEHRVAAVETDFRHGFGEMLTAAGANVAPAMFGQAAFTTTVKVPYKFGVVTQLLTEQHYEVPTGSFRSIYSGFVATSNEIMVDEIAAALKKDPYQFRRANLETDRQRAVLDTVAQMGRWGRAMPAGQAQGIAFHDEYRSHVAYLVEIDATGPEPRATAVFACVDVGVPINPMGLEAQVQGVFMDAWTIMFRAGNHLDNGRIREATYNDLPWARMKHSPPQIEVKVLAATTDSPGGAGELGLPAAAAAAVNAYARATRTKPRRFPIGC